MSFAALGWILWGILFGVAITVSYLSTRPGHRRKKCDPNFAGTDRRQSSVCADVVNQPVWLKHQCSRADCSVCRKHSRSDISNISVFH